MINYDLDKRARQRYFASGLMFMLVQCGRYGSISMREKCSINPVYCASIYILIWCSYNLKKKPHHVYNKKHIWHVMRASCKHTAIKGALCDDEWPPYYYYCSYVYKYCW